MTLRKLVSSCVFGLVGLATSAVADELPRSVWQTEIYADPMHKGGVIAAAEQISTPVDGVTVKAIVRCWSATLEGDVRFVLSSGEWLGGDAHWQFDRMRPRTDRWRRNPDGDAIVVPEALRADILRGLLAAKVLTLSLDGGSAFQIPLAGSSQAIGKAQEQCRHPH
jgi:hypothetical protein